MQNKPRDIAIKFETGAATHKGLVRQANEDSILASPDIGVWAVADGVGGYEAGQLASSTVTQALESIGPAVSAGDLVARFQDRINHANFGIHTLSEERGGAMMGSTVAALLIFERSFACLWSGDSRVYRLRAGQLEQISRDHSEVQELIDNGVLTREQARTYPRGNVITRAIGIFDDPGLELRQGEIEPGDTFLICSDGLTGHLDDAEIAARLAGRRSQDACDTLIAETLARGARDNVSIIIIRCHRVEATHFIPGSAA
ncbi:PP2C family protein-serine/threonine phosphatase [Bosea sp. (in: a-proteobacteria)]|uniref:PP2C family protein-serine/threonine phosphatase n=1 Tax=Bosea sp. (in: a-proteobacteria) TaxID=1871050 RepID=UPI003B3BAE04